MLQYVRTWFERAMTEADINSRLVFFLHGVGSTVAMIALTIAFIVAKNKESYPYMVGAVGGGAVGAAAGRYLTKKNGGDADVPKAAPKIEETA